MLKHQQVSIIHSFILINKWNNKQKAIKKNTKEVINIIQMMTQLTENSRKTKLININSKRCLNIPIYTLNKIVNKVPI